MDNKYCIICGKIVSEYVSLTKLCQDCYFKNASISNAFCNGAGEMGTF